MSSRELKRSQREKEKRETFPLRSLSFLRAVITADVFVDNSTRGSRSLAYFRRCTATIIEVSKRPGVQIFKPTRWRQAREQPRTRDLSPPLPLPSFCLAAIFRFGFASIGTAMRMVNGNGIRVFANSREKEGFLAQETRIENSSFSRSR